MCALAAAAVHAPVVLVPMSLKMIEYHELFVEVIGCFMLNSYFA